MNNKEKSILRLLLMHGRMTQYNLTYAVTIAAERITDDLTRLVDDGYVKRTYMGKCRGIPYDTYTITEKGKVYLRQQYGDDIEWRLTLVSIHIIPLEEVDARLQQHGRI